MPVWVVADHGNSAHVFRQQIWDHGAGPGACRPDPPRRGARRLLNPNLQQPQLR
jgi:hypothetical protein